MLDEKNRLGVGIYNAITLSTHFFRILKPDYSSEDEGQRFVDGVKREQEEYHDLETTISLRTKLWNMTKFMLPLAFCVMTPNVSEEVRETEFLLGHCHGLFMII